MKNEANTQDIAAIRQLGRKFSDTTVIMHAAIAQNMGLSGADHKYLGILVQNSQMTAGDLAKQTGLTTGAITGVIDRLEKKQLVERVFDKNDRRKVFIVPVKNNVDKLMGNSFESLQNKVVELLSRFDASETQVIKKYLLGAIKVMTEVTWELQNNSNK
jgi:DNA-binding MarR family transcriptional regulator